MRTITCVALVAAILGLSTGCIAIVEKGTRGRKIGKYASVNIQKEMKKEDVLMQLGEPDEIVLDGDDEILIYRATQGWYAVVVGKIEYFALTVRLAQGKVARVSADIQGESLHVLCNPAWVAN